MRKGQMEIGKNLLWFRVRSFRRLTSLFRRPFVVGPLWIRSLVIVTNKAGLAVPRGKRHGGGHWG